MNKRIILLDSSSVLHRVFHGIKQPRWADHNGEQINVAALHGYLTYVRILSYEMCYDELVHVFDPDGGSAARFALYPQYKGNRPPNDPVLTAQKPFLKPVMEAFGHKCLRIDGVESDDVISTLCDKYIAQGDDVCVVSADKDLMQLVVDGQVVFSRYVEGFGGRKTHEFYEEQDVFNKMGVRPDQIADYLALVGDSSDNIPGVLNVGPKKASQLLAEYGSLSAIMTNANDIPGKLGENIRAGLDMLPLYRKLTTTFKDVDVDIPDHTDSNRVIDPEKSAWVREFMNIRRDWPDDLDGDHRSYVLEEQLTAKRPGL